jgi:hypothetical protein
VVDSWWHGLPVVATPVGAEGMTAADAADGTAANVAAATAADAADGTAADEAAAATSIATQQPDVAAAGHVWQAGGAADGTGSRQEDWGGLCTATSAQGLAEAAALLYRDEAAWQQCQTRGFELLQLLYNRERNLGRVMSAVSAAGDALQERRRHDFIGSTLWQQQCRATEYFSRWIELKESCKEKV